MSIYRRGDSGVLWIAVWDARTQKTIRMSAETGDRKAAERFERQVRQQVEDGVFSPRVRGRLTLRSAFDQALETHWANSKSLASFTSQARVICSILGDDLPLAAITEGTVAELRRGMQGRGASLATTNRKMAALRKLLNLAATEWKVIQSAPKISTPKENRGRVRWLEPSEEAALLNGVRLLSNHALARYADYFAFLIDTGLRYTEGVELHRRDVSLERREFHVWESKGGTARTVPLTTRAHQLVAVRMHTDRPWGDMANLRQAEYAWSAVRTGMGLAGDKDFVIHALRHTFASRLLQRGERLEVVSQLLGHKSLQTTMIYAHLATHNLHEAVAKLEGARNVNLRGVK